MAGDKLQDAGEFTRWYSDENRPYEWIIQKYRDKYNIEIVHSTIGNWRSRLGLPRRQERNLDLVPWKVEARHRYKHALAMLRAEGRRRAGAPLSPIQQARLDSWLTFMRDQDCVVHYDPQTDQAFFYVPRRPGVDTDLVRVPDRKTRERGTRE